VTKQTKTFTAFSHKHLGSISRQQIIEGVKAHARANYESKMVAWDHLIECMSDEDIDGLMGKRTKSILGAIQMLADPRTSPLKVWAEQRQAVQAEAGEPSWEQAMADLEQAMAA
jgi:hypothetical protein